MSDSRPRFELGTSRQQMFLVAVVLNRSTGKQMDVMAHGPYLEAGIRVWHLLRNPKFYYRFQNINCEPSKSCPPPTVPISVKCTVTGFGLVNGFVDHLYTPLGITSSYNATANLHNSQITTAPAKPFPACCVFISRFLATASNSGDYSASRSQVLSSQTPV
jgi:hypothetical protein